MVLVGATNTLRFLADFVRHPVNGLHYRDDLRSLGLRAALIDVTPVIFRTSRFAFRFVRLTFLALSIFFMVSPFVCVE